MKTAVQQLIERIEQQLDSFHDDDNLSLSARGLQDAYINCKQWAFNTKEIEKKQIVDAYLSAVGYNGNCESHQMRMLDKRFLEQAEKYYNETTS